MTRLNLIFFMAVIAAGIALPLVVRQASQTPLREKNEVLSRQSVELAQLAAENSTLSNTLTATNGSPALSREQLEELLKLRSEISGPRQQTNEAVKLREQNRLLRERVNTEQNFRPQTVPRGSWSFAGYATPEAALQSFVWGMSRGDKKTAFGSLTDSAAESGILIMELPDAEFSATLSKLSENFTGYQIICKHVLSDDTVILLVGLEGGPTRDEQAMTIKKTGGEWKLHVLDLMR